MLRALRRLALLIWARAWHAGADAPRCMMQRLKWTEPTGTGDSAVTEAEAHLCNGEGPIPPVGPKHWSVSPMLMEKCWSHVNLRKNRTSRWKVSERNWCWVAYKDMCHRSGLRGDKHMSWNDIYNMVELESPGLARQAELFHPLDFPEVCDRIHPEDSEPASPEEQSAAYAWARVNLSVYVLNLEQDVEKWKSISGRLKELDITAVRVEGMDMRKPGTLIAAKHQGYIPREFNFGRAQQVAYQQKHNHGSLLGTLGCATAHFKAQAKAIASGSSLALVLEDDVSLVDDFIPRLWKLVTTELPCDWHVVSLNSRCTYGRCVSRHLARVLPDSNEPASRCRYGVTFGTQGVLYRVEHLPTLQALWKAVVFNESRPLCMDVDVALASIADQVGFYAVPAVQVPGFLHEVLGMHSARKAINKETSVKAVQAAV